MMKKKRVLTIGLLLSVSQVFAGVDPVLTAAVEMQRETINNTLKDIHKEQKKTTGFQAVMTLELERLHKVEKDVYDYLQNASSAIKDVHSIIKCGTLIIEISSTMKECIQEAGRNPKGAAISAVVSREIKDATLQATSLYSFVKPLVLSGAVDRNGDGNIGEGEKKVNLLNAAERFEILSKVEGTLDHIKYNFVILNWQIKMMNITSLWKSLDYESWRLYVGGKDIAEDIIRQWK